MEEKNNRFDCGILGTRVLFHVLSEFGYGELAYDMIMGPQFPSYGYWVEQGETTLCEAFFSDKYAALSHNHHFFDDVSHWYMEKLAGLEVILHDKLRIKPDFIRQLDFAEARYELPAGKAVVSWKRTEKGIKLEVKSPVEYTVVLPDGYAEKNGYIVC